MLTARGLPRRPHRGPDAGRRRLSGQAVRAGGAAAAHRGDPAPRRAARRRRPGALALGRCSFDPGRGELFRRRRAGAAHRGARRSCCASWRRPPHAPVDRLELARETRRRRRPRGRHPGHPPAAQDRGRPEEPALPADRARRRLHAGAGLMAPRCPRLPSLLWRCSSAALPTSLFGRSLLIIVLPIAMMQIAVTWVFFDAHWQTVNSHLTEGLAGDVAWVVQSYEDDPDAGRPRSACRTAPSSRSTCRSRCSPARRCRTVSATSLFGPIDRSLQAGAGRPHRRALLVRHRPLPGLRRHPGEGAGRGAAHHRARATAPSPPRATSSSSG